MGALTVTRGRPLPGHLARATLLALTWTWLQALALPDSPEGANVTGTPHTLNTLPAHGPGNGSLAATSSSPIPRYYIGALFEVKNVSVYANDFRGIVDNFIGTGTVELALADVNLTDYSDVRQNLRMLCEAVRHYNITVFFVMGNQDIINILSIVTKYVGIPVLGYNIEKTVLNIRGERPLYLQFDPSKALLARALTQTLQRHNWYYASVIVEDEYVSDGFLHAFRTLTSTDPWHIEDQIVLSLQYSLESIDYKLHALLENKSRVIILHCSPTLAIKVFQVAEQNGFIREGYAWFVTEDVDSKDLKKYPIGLVKFELARGFNYMDLFSDVVNLVSRATARYVAERGHDLMEYASNKDCRVMYSEKEYQSTLMFYRYLKTTSFKGETGDVVTFDEDGKRTKLEYNVYNLVDRNRFGKRWRKVGSYKNGSYKIDTIVWPGNTVTGPIHHGERTLRVVTNIVAPFVMEQDAIHNTCTTSVPCLRVTTSDKEQLDDIFKDFERHQLNASRTYNVSCCQGLSIMLLEKLARDLNFRYHLYIVHDGKYGHQTNGTWDGLVQDLLGGGAHMAVAPFSITRARSRAIDFTDPYFFSGFSILVSERKRKTPIYAFMEPFDGWVWISVIFSATVMAVAVSVLEWNSPFGLNPWGRKRRSNYTFGSGINMVYAIFFQHTIRTKSPKAWPSKVIQNFWAASSIFIYSSYTANLAAFLAGKNSGVTITGIHDPKLLEPGRQVGLIQGNAVEEILSKVNYPLYAKALDFPGDMSIDVTLAMLMNASIDAYLDDTPILEYARATMDGKCMLRLIGEGFGEDGYGIGLPKGSWLKLPLTQKILEYHESGYIEDLQELYFRRSKCSSNVFDGQLQGEASPMVFTQHAGLYLLLLVGIFVCILLMLLEHATFKWLVPYWRGKPIKSFWKSYSMLFVSQRLYRIITSEELVSPHHSAREMIEVVRNRDFTKLFQKSVKKQERQARNRKNLFSIVEQLQWKQRREERLSQHPSMQTDCSQDSDNSATPVNLNRRHCRLDDQAATDTNDEPGDDWPENWEKEWIADDDAEEEDCLAKVDTHPLYKGGVVNHSFNSQADLLKQSSSDAEPMPGPVGEREEDEVICVGGRLDLNRPNSQSVTAIDLMDYSLDGAHAAAGNDTDDEVHSDRLSPGMPLLGNSSSSEDNLLTGAGLPNGILILAPNGDLFARDATSGRSILVRPKNIANIKNFTTNLPQSIKTLPLNDNRVKSSLLSRSRTLDRLNEGTITNDIDPGGCHLDTLTKEQVYFMWKANEKDLNSRLHQALQEKAELEERLARLEGRPEST